MTKEELYELMDDGNLGYACVLLKEKIKECIPITCSR